MKQHSSEQPKEHCGIEYECTMLERSEMIGTMDGAICVKKNCKYGTRSRPHPAPAPDCEDIMSTGYEQGVKDGARKAREKVLKEFDSALNMVGEDRNYQLYNMKEVLKSLRQQAGEP